MSCVGNKILFLIAIFTLVLAVNETTLPFILNFCHKNYGVRCMGHYISNNWVLSLTSLVGSMEWNEDVEIVGGRESLRKCEGPQRRKIQKIIHTKHSRDNNIALIKLVAPFDTTKHIVSTVNFTKSQSINDLNCFLHIFYYDRLRPFIFKAIPKEECETSFKTILADRDLYDSEELLPKVCAILPLSESGLDKELDAYPIVCDNKLDGIIVQRNATRFLAIRLRDASELFESYIEPSRKRRNHNNCPPLNLLHNCFLLGLSLHLWNTINFTPM